MYNKTFIMLKLFTQTVLSFLLLASLFGCKKSVAEQPVSPVQAITHSPSFPIIKGLSTNPVVRLSITVPDDNPEQQFNAIKGTINTAAVNSIQKIDLFLTGAQPFVAGEPLASIQPAANFEVKLDLKLKPGVYFIWFSIVLKADASIDGKIELLCKDLIYTSGKTVAISKDETDHAKRIGVAVRKAGDDNVHTYRIPGLISTNQGTLIAVYDNRYTGTGDLPGNIDVGMSRSTDGGKTWEPMKIIMDMGAPQANNGVGDPAILFDPIAKRLWVSALWSKGNRSIAGSLPGLSPDTTGQFVVVSSDDDGRTWTTPKTITPQIKDPKWHIFFNGPGSGIAMQDGKLVFAAQYWDEAKMPFSTIIYSEDRGTTWKGNILGAKSNTTESQVVETTPGKLMLNMRDNRGRFRSVATTSNMGATWTEHGTSYSALQDPVCMASLIKANVNVGGAAKDMLFFSNPNTSSGRYNITIKASSDLGETWPKNNQLLIDDRQCYGYSSLTRIDENTIGLLYEGTRDLYFVKVPVSELMK
jgi:sialidase-1